MHWLTDSSSQGNCSGLLALCPLVQVFQQLRQGPVVLPIPASKREALVVQGRHSQTLQQHPAGTKHEAFVDASSCKDSTLGHGSTILQAP